MDDITAVEKLRHNAILPTTWSIQRGNPCTLPLKSTRPLSDRVATSNACRPTWCWTSQVSPAAHPPSNALHGCDELGWSFYFAR